LLKKVVLDKAPVEAAVGKPLVVPRVYLTAAARHNLVVLGLVELEELAGTPVAAVEEEVGSVAEVAEQMMILAALMPAEAAVGLHMQTRL
jgi:hypothetical protein